MYHEGRKKVRDTDRHEVKCAVTALELRLLSRRLGAVLPRDSHARGGSYEIRSLYFDTPDDRALREKLDGIGPREKFRLRCYNGDLSYIVLEKKARIRGLCRKTQARLSEDEARRIAAGDTAGLGGSDSALLRELALRMSVELLRPKTVVVYTREPFVYAPGNVRVTLDSDLRSSLGPADFFDPDGAFVPAGGSGGILELKWDAFLPDLIRDLVQLPGRGLGSFSKYAACRLFDERGD